MAAAGLTTVAWNPFPDVPWGHVFPDRPPRPNDEATIVSLSACVDAMEQKLGLKAIASLGFCMGGRFALLHGAREPRLRAVSAAYPSLPPQRQPGQDIDPLPMAAQIRCPVQILYAGADVVTPREMFGDLQSTLQAREAESAILVFPTAGHGFFHDHSEANDAAACVADPQIKAFLAAHLAP